MATMHVELVSVERALWSGEATAVFARTTEGELGILPGHIPLLGALEPGWMVRIDRDGEGELRVAVHGGFLSVREDGVSVLAEMAELADDIDVARARARSSGRGTTPRRRGAQPGAGPAARRRRNGLIQTRSLHVAPTVHTLSMSSRLCLRACSCWSCAVLARQRYMLRTPGALPVAVRRGSAGGPTASPASSATSCAGTARGRWARGRR